MCNVVRSISILNANKFPSKTGTYTTSKNLNEGFNKCKELIENQIEVLQPQINIFCSTFYLYKNYFGLSDEHLISEDPEYNWILEKDGKLFLNVYHPANRRKKREVYVNKIVNAVENWIQRSKANISS